MGIENARLVAVPMISKKRVMLHILEQCDYAMIYAHEALEKGLAFTIPVIVSDFLLPKGKFKVYTPSPQEIEEALEDEVVSDIDVKAELDYDYDEAFFVITFSHEGDR